MAKTASAKVKKDAQKVPVDLLGPVELFVLTAVMKLGDEAYGMSVFDFIREHVPYKRISFGSIYTALERMTWKGYLEGRLGEPEPTRGGRARKYYRTTGLGEAVLKSTTESFRAIAEAPPGLCVLS